MNDLLLSEFIDAWNAGRRPRVHDYLARLPDGPARDELADAITDWLSVAPTPAYSERTRGEIRAEAFALAGLRERAGFSVRELAQRVAGVFGLGDVDRAERLSAPAGERRAGRVARLAAAARRARRAVGRDACVPARGRRAVPCGRR